MNHWAEHLALITILILNLWILGTSRVRVCIRIAAIQGVILSLLPVLAAHGTPTVREVMLTIASVAIKGILFPWLLFRALRGSGVSREANPIVGYSASIMIGLALLGVAISMSKLAPMVGTEATYLALTVSLATMLAGLALIMMRRKALMQLLGYIVIENGIFAFGFAMEIRSGALVELGILIDALFAVLVMGIAIYHMHRTFDAIDVDHLTNLKDWNP